MHDTRPARVCCPSACGVCALLLSSWAAASAAAPAETPADEAADPGQEEPSCLLQRTARQGELAAAAEADERLSRAGPAQRAGAGWAILGLTKFKVKAEHQGEWWPSVGDIFAKVVVGPENYQYSSRVHHDTLDGDLDLHLYLLANSTEVTISLYDHDTFSAHDLVGSASFALLGPGSGCDQNKASMQGGCPLEWSIKKTGSGAEVESATLQGYLAMGDEMFRAARAANKRGVLVVFEEGTRNHHVFELARIQNDRIEEELFYAEAGSVFPESLHGILWMDQRGRSLSEGPYPSDPEYRQVCSTAAEENLVHFGEAAWNPETLCVTGVRQYSGGPLSGHWTWMDEGGGKSSPWASGLGWHMKYDFCFRDKTMTYIDVLNRISANRLIKDMFGIADFLPVDFEVTMPVELFNVAMIKKPWGWDRKTMVGPEWLREMIKANIDNPLIGFLIHLSKQMGLPVDRAMIENGITCHYPVLPVVDGHGRRTENYAAYLKYLNNQTTCANATFDCPVNRGKGTHLVGRLSAASYSGQASGR